MACTVGGTPLARPVRLGKWGGARAPHWITVNYREAYGMYASNGILFNH